MKKIDVLIEGLLICRRYDDDYFLERTGEEWKTLAGVRMKDLAAGWMDLSNIRFNFITGAADGSVLTNYLF